MPFLCDQKKKHFFHINFLQEHEKKYYFKNLTEASASVCLLLATALVF